MPVKLKVLLLVCS